MDAAVIKVGGSLAAQPEKLRSLCAKLNEISRWHSLVLVPGGGEFADTVRNLDKRFSLSPTATHRMAILSMDQYGLLLSDLLPKSIITREFGSLQHELASGSLLLFLPSAFLFSDQTLENSWDVTSDSIAVHITKRLHLARTILVTDVDGIYTCDPKRFQEAKLIMKLSARELLRMNKRTSVDSFLPKMLLRTQIECFVVNGLYPQRIEDALRGKETVCTQITTS